MQPPAQIPKWMSRLLSTTSKTNSSRMSISFLTTPTDKSDPMEVDSGFGSTGWLTPTEGPTTIASLDSMKAEVNTETFKGSTTAALPAVDPPDVPFIYRPHVVGTVCELLSIADQYENGIPAAETDAYEDIIDATVTKIFFPPCLEAYDYETAAVPGNLWTCRATINGVKLSADVYPSNYFRRRCGITLSDYEKLVERLRKAYSTNDLWKEVFEHRGMPLECFKTLVLNIQNFEEQRRDRFRVTTQTGMDSVTRRRVTAKPIPGIQISNLVTTVGPRPQLNLSSTLGADPFIEPLDEIGPVDQGARRYDMED